MRGLSVTKAIEKSTFCDRSSRAWGFHHFIKQVVVLTYIA
jgi:hypothetical protein